MIDLNGISRRGFLRNIGLASSLLAVSGSISGCGLLRPSASSSTEGETRPWYELGMMADPILDQVLLFYLGSVWQGLADVGECLDIASRVEAGDPWSWTTQWHKGAEHLRSMAKNAEFADHTITAGEMYLRAANYDMAALHRHPEPYDPTTRAWAELATESYNHALRLLPLHGTPVEIPYESGALPGLLFRSPIAESEAPLLIVHQGRDAWADQCKFMADAGMKRGYHVLLFDGPGQGKALRIQGLPFRPDWENVITPVVDYAIGLPGVDSDRIGLLGISMGGALAPRAAAFEKRLKICAANPGVVNWGEITAGYIGYLVGFDKLELAQTDPERFDRLLLELASENPFLDWGLKDSMWKHGVDSPSALIRDLARYNNTSIVNQIECNMLVIDGEADEFSQAQALYDALSSPKTYLRFTAEDSGLAHSQTGALAISSERIYDWLDENLM